MYQWDKMSRFMEKMDVLFHQGETSQFMKNLKEYYSRTECHSKLESIWGSFIQLMQCHTEIKCHIPGNRGWTFGFCDKQPPPPHPQSGIEREILGRWTLEWSAEKCPSGHLVWVKMSPGHSVGGCPIKATWCCRNGVFHTCNRHWERGWDAS